MGTGPSLPLPWSPRMDRKHPTMARQTWALTCMAPLITWTCPPLSAHPLSWCQEWEHGVLLLSYRSTPSPAPEGLAL